MLPNERSYWIRWLSVFFLVSFGSSLFFGGLDQAMNDRQPLQAFIGFWIAQAAFLVAPGAVIGGVVALASSKPMFGAKVMIIINLVIAVLLVIGAILQMRN